MSRRKGGGEHEGVRGGTRAMERGSACELCGTIKRGGPSGTY
ncbi:hypothetical protein E2C01_079551 [Portunus trituberculatus]|uniref:Uncharacterized protein n=1 Tax=Portunus trituberculatus TaxID=210409 RepID=A0A5B7IH73_PORTR|nr:hypothetical protein [Portunus trituberculatus]